METTTLPTKPSTSTASNNNTSSNITTNTNYKNLPLFIQNANTVGQYYIKDWIRTVFSEIVLQTFRQHLQISTTTKAGSTNDENDRNDNDNDNVVVVVEVTDDIISLAINQCIVLATNWSNQLQQIGHEQISQLILSIVFCKYEQSTLYQTQFNNNVDNDDFNVSTCTDNDNTTTTDIDIDTDTIQKVQQLNQQHNDDDTTITVQDNNNNQSKIGSNNSSIHSPNSSSSTAGRSSLNCYVQEKELQEEEKQSNLATEEIYDSDDDTDDIDNDIDQDENDTNNDSNTQELVTTNNSNNTATRMMMTTTAITTRLLKRLRDIGKHNIISINNNYIPYNTIDQQLDTLLQQYYNKQYVSCIQNLITAIPQRLYTYSSQNNTNDNTNNNSIENESYTVDQQHNTHRHDYAETTNDSTAAATATTNLLVQNAESNTIDTITESQRLFISKKRKYTNFQLQKEIKRKKKKQVTFHQQQQQQQQQQSTAIVRQQQQQQQQLNIDNFNTIKRRKPSRVRHVRIPIADICNQLSIEERQQLDSLLHTPLHNDEEEEEGLPVVTTNVGPENSSNNNNTNNKNKPVQVQQHVLLGSLQDVGCYHYYYNNSNNNNMNNNNAETAVVSSLTTKQIRRRQRDAIRDRLGNHMFSSIVDDNDNNGNDVADNNNNNNNNTKKSYKLNDTMKGTSKILPTIQYTTSQQQQQQYINHYDYTNDKVNELCRIPIINDQEHIMQQIRNRRQRQHWFDLDMSHCFLEFTVDTDTNIIATSTGTSSGSDGTIQKILCLFHSIEMQLLDEE